jgi:hypothetical protein
LNSANITWIMLGRLFAIYRVIQASIQRLPISTHI